VVDPLVILFGLGVGALVGVTGIGGGSLMTPLLILFTGTPPAVAVGTDLAYGAVTKTLGGWRHLRKGTVDLGVSGWLAAGSVPGAALGVAGINAVHDRYGTSVDRVMLVAIAVTLLVVAVITLLRAAFLRALVARERHTVELTTRVRWTAAAIGLVLGCVVGATSVGSGALIGLALIFIFRLTPHRVVGTDVFHAAILLWVAGLAHWISGNVDLLLMANILAGSIPGVLAGTHMIDRVPATGLRALLGCVLLGSALALLKKSGTEVPTGAIVGLPAVAAAALWTLHHRHTRSTRRPSTITTATLRCP